LQLVGTNALRDHFNPDLWLLTFANRVRQNPEQHVVISDVRFPNELKFIEDNDGVLLNVSRGNSPVWYETALLANRGNVAARAIMENTYPAAHLSEWAWVGAKFDYYINNNGTLDELKSKIRDIMSVVL
jgi:hypothetical protein